RLQLLVEASGALASSLDSTNALAEIAHLAVQSFADWCAIDLIEDGAVRRLPVAHADPAKAALARELARLGPHAARAVLAAALAIDRARLYEEAREANRRKDEFLAVVSHELRTPLAPLLTWAEILRRQPDAAHARQAAGVIERNIHLLRGLITELLDLASITG